MSNLKEKIDFEDILKDIKRKDTPQRYCIFIFSMFFSALVFNVFYAKFSIVTGGSAGLSIIIKYLTGFDESKFVLYVSLALLVLCFFTLGFKQTLRNTIGTLLYPLFIKITSYLVVYFNVETDSLLLIALYAGILSGFASGIMMKTKFTAGGFNILYQIANKYFKISIGKSSLIINSLIIIFGAIVFGVPMAIYAVIALYLSTVITDKVLLGTSRTKSFYIVTDKEQEVKQYIVEKLNHGVTVIDAKGGYSKNKKKMLLCVIPTSEYFILKEVVLTIDKNAFFLITDSYEVSGAI